MLGHSLLSPKATRDPAGLGSHRDTFGMVAFGTCRQDLLREAAEEQRGAGNVAQAGDQPLVADVPQPQAALAALGDLLVLQHLVQDLGDSQRRPPGRDLAAGDSGR